jgi:hypothetical protein
MPQGYFAHNSRLQGIYVPYLQCIQSELEFTLYFEGYLGHFRVLEIVGNRLNGRRQKSPDIKFNTEWSGEFC